MTSPAAPRSATTPEELNSIFKVLLEAGDLDGLLTLYEENAVLVAGPDQLATGHAQIREGLAPFVGMQAKITFESAAVAYAGDIALVHAKWTGAGTTPEGPIELAGTTSEVVRRQADGTWKYLIDDPGFGVTAP